MNRCVCCGSILDGALANPRLRLQKCRECGTFRAAHLNAAAGTDIWKSQSITPTFLAALAQRRAIQSKIIMDRFKGMFSEGPILDYGCGQGVFVAELLARDFDAMGCDLSAGVLERIRPEHYLALAEPWSMPQRHSFKTITLLDVLEHCADPATLIGKIRELGVQHVIAKVPSAHGPIFLLALVLAQAGRGGLLEKLFLVGDVVPHVSYFTSRGVIRLFEESGFSLVSSSSMAEIGPELPQRIRGSSGFAPPTTLTLRLGGQLLEGLARWWSDTTVFRFDLR